MLIMSSVLAVSTLAAPIEIVPHTMTVLMFFAFR